MSVPVRPASRPVNVPAFWAATFGSLAWHFWPSTLDGSFSMASAGLCAAVAVPAAIRTGAELARDYRLRVKLAQAEDVTENHGTAREAEWPEIVARAMHDPASGNFLGLCQGKHPVFVPPRTPFCVIEAPPGAGKTSFLVISSILHQARLGKSLFIPDVKTELAPMLVPVLKAMGLETWCINPTHAYADLCPDAEINLYQSVLDACHDPGAFRRDTIKLALDLANLHLPEPKGGEDRNAFFRNGSRRCLGLGILSQALLDPARCTPGDVFALLNDPRAFRKRLVFLRYEIARQFPEDGIAAFLATEAANMLDKFEHNEEHAASFLEGATQPLIAFNQGGRMAGYGRTASVNIAVMRRRQVIVFVMAPLANTRDFAPVVSLLNHSLMEAAKRHPAGHPVHIVGEEFLNYRFADIASDMETMRGLRLSMDIYIQSFDGLVRKFGRETAAAIEAYADVKVYLGLNGFERARHVSNMLAEATIRGRDYSTQADARDIGVSNREMGRRLMTADEILAMPRDQAWVFVRGLRPLRLTMVDYGRITPWRDEVGPNPLEGPALRGKPLFAIRYPTGKRPVLDGTPRPPKTRAARGRRFVWPVRAAHLLWLVPVLALWAAIGTRPPLPHLLFSYSDSGSRQAPYYHECSYVGPSPRTIHPMDGRCPLIRFFPQR